jgi:hypothetical protein
VLAGTLMRGAIFISYATEDIEAASTLFAGLREIVGDDVWFDKVALTAGDEVQQTILNAVQRCSLFLPLLSDNAQARTEGYFRLEWKGAAARSHKIQGRKFILPIVIASDYTGAMGRFDLVPEEFKALKYTHAPAGQMTDDLKVELQEQVRILRGGKSV